MYIEYEKEQLLVRDFFFGWLNSEVFKGLTA